MTVAQLNAVLTLKSDLSKALKKEGQSIDSFVSQSKAAFKRFDDDAKKPIEALKGHLKSLGQTMTQVGVAMTAAVTVPMIAAGKASFDAAVQMDSVTRSLTVIMGSASAAKKELDALFQVARLPGLTFQQAVKGSQQLQAVGYEAEKSRQILADLGNSISLMGGSDEEFARMIVNIRQVSSMSRLTGDELREMSAIIPGIAKSLRQAFGTDATEDLKKMGVTGAEALNVIFAAMHNAPTADPNSIQNQIENMKNDFFLLKAAVGEALIPVFTDISNRVLPVIHEMTDKFKAMTPEAKRALVIFAGAAAALGPMILAFGTLASSVGTITTLFKSLSGVFTTLLPALGAATGEAGLLGTAIEVLTGPVGLVIAAVVALGTAFATNFAGLRTTLTEAWKYLTEAFGQIAIEFQNFYAENKEWIDLLVRFMKEQLIAEVQLIAQTIAGIIRNMADVFRWLFGTVSDLFKVFKALFTGDWTNFWKGIMNIQQRWTNLINQLFANFIIGALNMGKSLIKAVSPALDGLLPAFDIGISMVEKWKSNMNKAVDSNKVFAESTKKATEAVKEYQKLPYIPNKIPPRKTGGGKKGGRPKPLGGNVPDDGFAPVDPFADGAFAAGVKEMTGLYFESAEQLKNYSDAMSKLRLELGKSTAAGKEQELLVKFGLSDAWDGFNKGQQDTIRFMIAWVAGAEAQAEAAKKLKDAYDSASSGLSEQIALLGKEGETAQLQYRLTEGDLKGLTQAEKDHLLSQRRQIDAFEEAKAHAELYHGVIDGLKESVALLGNESERARLIYRMTAGDLTGLTEAEKAEALALQDRIDLWNKGKAAWDKFWAAVKEAGERQAEKRKTSYDKYNDLLKEQLNRVLNLTQGFDALRRAELEEAFAGETNAKKRQEMIDKVLDVTKTADQIEAIKKLIEEAADHMSKVFMDAFDSLFNDGFKGFFDNVIQGFRDLLRKMAEEYLQAQITSWLTGAIGGLFKGPGHRASGGSVFPGDPFIVGERGPELFVPSSSGTVIPNHQMAGAGGPNVNVTINIAANDPGTFLRSKGQIASSIWREVSRQGSRDYR